MTGDTRCLCVGPRSEKKQNWVVLHRNHNHSVFEYPAGKEHPSAYSAILCKKCQMVWRSKARYVDDLPNAERKDYL